MKKITASQVVLMAASFFFTATTNAQFGSSDIAGLKPSSSTVTYNADADKVALAGLKEVNNRMFTHFTKNFKNASNLKIRSVDVNGSNHGMRVDFKFNGNNTGIRYDAKGRWMFTISYYDESKLDDQTRRTVESAYPGFLVGGAVIEIQVLDKTAKLIIIENKKEWKRIRLVDGELSIYEQYTKQ